MTSSAGQLRPTGSRPLDEDALGWLLDSDDTRWFLDEYLDRKPVLARGGDPDRFRSLLSLERLDVILGTYGLKHQSLRLISQDRPIAAQEYVSRGDRIDAMRVGRLFAEGATVIFEALHERDEQLQRLCSELSAQATARTQANIYLTPPRAQGFAPHWDSHDVFVLQIEGSKDWRMYENAIERPLPSQSFDSQKEQPGEAVAEFTLQRGDVLYIPRGMMHSAVSHDLTSLHVTLGLIPYTWADFAADCLTETAVRDPEWRECLPFGFGHRQTRAKHDLRAELVRRLGALLESADVDRVVQGRRQLVDAAHRPGESDFLRQALGASSVKDGDVVRLRSRLLTRVERRDERFVVSCGERDVRFPLTAGPALEALASGRRMRVRDIDDELDPASRAVLVSTLIREGIVVNLGSSPALVEED